jgi:hypothetical protein
VTKQWLSHVKIPLATNTGLQYYNYNRTPVLALPEKVLACSRQVVDEMIAGEQPAPRN